MIQLLKKGGARQDMEITDLMTHFITGEDPNKDDVSLNNDVYECPLINYRWVVLSAKCNIRLPYPF